MTIAKLRDTRLSTSATHTRARGHGKREHHPTGPRKAARAIAKRERLVGRQLSRRGVPALRKAGQPATRVSPAALPHALRSSAALHALRCGARLDLQQVRQSGRVAQQHAERAHAEPLHSFSTALERTGNQAVTAARNRSRAEHLYCHHVPVATGSGHVSSRYDGPACVPFPPPATEPPQFRLSPPPCALRLATAVPAR